jgi:hypothetical protein
MALMEMPIKAIAETPEQMADLLAKADQAEYLLSIIGRRIEGIREAGVAMMSDGTKVPGWKVKPGKRTRKVDDLQAAFEAMQAAGFSAPEFVDCCKLSVPDLEAKWVPRYQAQHPDATQKVAKEAFLMLLGTLLLVDQAKAKPARE